MIPPISKTNTLEKEFINQLSKRYKLGDSAKMLEIEEQICGCRYGATSWTTKAEAEQIGEFLSIAEGENVLEVGAGSGWPGLYLASKFELNMTLVDLPLSGLLIAQNRIIKDKLKKKCTVLSANTYELPFLQHSFGSILHCDLLCCLSEKELALSAMRNVIKKNGSMIFSVISITPGLSKKMNKQAIKSAPIFAKTDSSYPDMLDNCNWRLLYQKNLTTAYLKSVTNLIVLEDKNKKELQQLMGVKTFQEIASYRKATKYALETNLIRRDLYQVIAV